ncbi:heavy-metal-associated domain-containing protein [Pedobacter nutrimenti]|jgi:copper chaperone|uniref:Copper chaperone n=1 Tax=Pedobacter nutrimenti TaxID=1241337 RepID=A0A318UKE7_9SPHI|nr:heavy-metal-associated domain-containing protein [Pedobacter nutrimenti]PYF76844.1 copper chaperone [Pedobacter nutrimenti]
MKTLKFKTNIKCGGCIATVTPFLNQMESIQAWEVDVNNPEKVLTVNGETDPAQVISTLDKAGFKAEAL